MPSLIETLVDRIQGAATPSAPTPFNRVPQASVTVAPALHGIARRLSDIPTEQQLPDDLFKGMLDSEDRIPERSRKGKAGYIHVSSLIGMCARAQVLSIRHGIEVHQPVTGMHRVMWKFGRAVEKHVREGIIRNKKFANVYGLWKCACKRTESLGFFTSQTCATCKGKLDVYNEAVQMDHENGITGSPDLLYRHAAPFVIVEVKSMTGADWTELTQPLGDHVFQAAMYHYLMKKNGHPVYDEVVIFYVTKHFTKFGSPYKEFHVDVSTPEIQQLVLEAVALAHSVKAAQAQSIIPVRTQCDSQACKRAKACPAANLCFGLQPS